MTYPALLWLALTVREGSATPLLVAYSRKELLDELELDQRVIPWIKDKEMAIYIYERVRFRRLRGIEVVEKIRRNEIGWIYWLIQDPSFDPSFNKNKAIQEAAKHERLEIMELLLED